ncbi:MAG: DNA polymerase III subunit epsilon [Lentisphaerae bacterium GWF2_45_14]|nr:MAG: DNA polymerase III subunit epsilon [Lentisphaerae bacterium GWF2_45_14]
MFEMKLERPVVFFDLETTGTNIQNDRIVEISVVKIFPNGERETKTRRINPEMHIPEESSKIHGITDKDVESEPVFKAISKNLYIYLEGCDLAGYNILKFDIPVLSREFNRAGLKFSLEGRKALDPYVIFCKLMPRTLTAAYKFFCDKDLVNAHGAEADVNATIDVFEAQLRKYPELPRDVAGINDYCGATEELSWIDSTGRFKWKNSEAAVGFGKNTGTLLRSIASENPGFLRWMLNSDFPEDAKKIAADAIKGEFPVKEQAQ